MSFKKEKFILQPGKVCTFDVNNILKKDEMDSVIFVEIKEEIPKKNLLGPRWFKIIGTGDDFKKLPQPVEVPETMLSPSGMVVIRYPSDFPIINEIDIKALNDVIKMTETYALYSASEWHKNTINRAKALKEKLEFSMKTREV